MSPREEPFWNQKRIDRLRDDWLAEPRLTTEVIAALHGVSRSSISNKIGWMRKNGYPDLPMRGDPDRIPSVKPPRPRKLKRGETTLPALSSIKESK